LRRAELLLGNLYYLYMRTVRLLCIYTQLLATTAGCYLFFPFCCLVFYWQPKALEATTQKSVTAAGSIEEGSKREEKREGCYQI